MSCGISKGNSNRNVLASERVDDKGGGVEHEFQQFTEEVLYRLLHVVHRAVHVHPAGFYRVQYTQFIQLVVKGFLIH